MSFPAHLVPSAKSAYRSIFRAARVTFIGDKARRVAFQTAIRQTFSSPTLTAPTPASASSDAVSEPEASVSEEELVKRIEGWQEVAQFLKKNVVQGVMDESGSYQLRVTEDTELGENTSIKTPPKLPTTPFPNRNRRRKCGDTEPSST